MKKQKKQLLVMLVVLALFVAAFFVIKYVMANQEIETETVSVTKIYHADKESIKGVQIVRENDTLDLVRDGDTWGLKDDKSAKLNQDSVDSVIGFAAYLNASDIIEEPGDLSEYGLDNPMYVVTITDALSSQQTYFVGDECVLDGTYFAKLEGSDTIYKIAYTYPNSFSTEIESLKE